MRAVPTPGPTSRSTRTPTAGVGTPAPPSGRATRRAWGRGARGGVAAVPALLAALALLLAGCVAIPTEGDIGEGMVDVPDAGAGIPLAADDPTVDAPPEQIVKEFLRAGAAGLTDDFTTARKFLTVTAASEWDPLATVLVYRGGEPSVTLRPDDVVVVSVQVSAVVDAQGRYTERVPGAAPHEITFRMHRDGTGQWRVRGLEDGVLMNAANFESQFRRTEIYFASHDLAHLVPETRWFPVRRLESAAVAALVEGPSPWLRDAVRTGFPEGARLRNGAVTVRDGVAVVDLAADLAATAAGDRELLQAQLEATLVQLTGRVRGAEVTVGGFPWEARRDQMPSLTRDVAPDSGPYVLARDRLAVVERGEARPLEDAAPLTGLDAGSPALSPDGATRVVLSDARRLLLVPRDGSAPSPLVTGDALLAPSVDRFQWVWTGERRSAGRLLAVRGTGERVPVAADWLTGHVVRSLRVSRDGSRIAVAYSVPGETEVTVEVAGITRDEEGVPVALSAERLAVGAVLETATEVSWIDDSTLGVLGASEVGTADTAAGVVVHLVPLGGPTDALPLIDGALGIAAGRGDRVHAWVAPDVLYTWQNASWVVVAEGVTDPVFPG